MASMSCNLPILSIPLYYILAAYPHGHAVALAIKNDPKPYDNRNPKGGSRQEELKRRLTPRQYAAYERGESCHRNHLENMPL